MSASFGAGGSSVLGSGVGGAGGPRGTGAGGPSVLVALPCYTGIADRTGVGLFNLGKWFERTGIRNELLTLTNSSLISKVRSRIANLFLYRTDFEYLLFIDSDIGFQVSDVEKLLELRAPVAAAPYSMKVLPPRYNFSLTLDQQRRLIRNDAGNAVQVDHIGTGFMLIHRSVFERLIRAFPELHFRPDPESSNQAFSEKELTSSYHFFETMIDPATRVQLSEDLAFCRRCRSVGIEIWMRTDTQLTHTGNYVFQATGLREEFESALKGQVL